MKKIIKHIFYLVCILGDLFLKDNKARVLMYHSHLLPKVFFNVTPDNLSWQLNFLLKRGYKFIFAKDLVGMLARKESLKNIIVITYDDGHIDFLETAMPEFREKHIPVTLFWPKEMKENKMFTSDGTECLLINKSQIDEIKDEKILEIGSHGLTHRELTSLSNEELISECRRDGGTSFAYPRGKFGQREKDVVKESGYSISFSTKTGFVDLDTDVYEVPRISIDVETDKLAFRAKLSTLFGIYAKVRR